MQAVVLAKCGPPSVLEHKDDYPMPVRRPGEVLVRIWCTSVNPYDCKIRAGAIPKFMIVLPQVLGGDVAGTVVGADPDCKFKTGQRVYGLYNGYHPNRKTGTYAGYVSVPEGELAHVPDALSWEEAAGVPMTFMTAWQALERSMPLKGKRVLVHAGAGGVGSFAIQIAKAQGAHVTTTCSAVNADYVRTILGADEAVDYRAAPFERTLRSSGAAPFDLVVDLIGGDYEPRSRQLTRRGGRYVLVMTGNFRRFGGVAGWALSQVWARAAAFTGGPQHSVIVVETASNRGLEQAAELLQSGQVKVQIDRVLPLSDVAAAHEYVQGQHARGKVVLRVHDSGKEAHAKATTAAVHSAKVGVAT